MDGYTQKIWEELMLFTGEYVNGKPGKGKYELDNEALVHLLGRFEKRIRALEANQPVLLTSDGPGSYKLRWF